MINLLINVDLGIPMDIHGIPENFSQTCIYPFFLSLPLYVYCMFVYTTVIYVYNIYIYTVVGYLSTWIYVYIYTHSWICIQICIYMSGQPPLLHLCVQLYLATNTGVLKDGPRPQLNSLTSKDSPKVSAASKKNAADWCDEEPLHTALQLRGITRGAAGSILCGLMFVSVLVKPHYCPKR